ncbi:MAG: TetR/AcrR family transcriptional regulator [Chloroflexota bacterium]
MNRSPTRAERKAAKHQKIVDAAMRIFAQQGYTGASLDAIALEAGVSKPTLYQYFGNKEKLFEAVLQQATDRLLLPFSDPAQITPMVAAMVNWSRNYANLVLSPDILSLGRLVMGEAERFPQIGKHYYENGPQKAFDGIVAYLEAQARAGRLTIEDSKLAAHDFWSLILSGPREMCLLMPELVLDSAEIDRFIFNGLRVFLKAYSSEPAVDLQELARMI